MGNRLGGFFVYSVPAALIGALLGVSNVARTGTVIGIDNPHRVRGEFIVELKREHILSLNNPTLTAGPKNLDSPQWHAARAAVAAEIAQIVDKLTRAHPHVRISWSSTPEVVQTLNMKASDKDARSVADEPEVERVESLDGDTVIRNTTLTTGTGRRTGLVFIPNWPDFHSQSAVARLPIRSSSSAPDSMSR